MAIDRTSAAHPTRAATSSSGRAARHTFVCAAGAICCLLSTGAVAADRMFAGSYCQPRVATDDVEYDHFGVVNVGAAAAAVECPFWLPFQGGLTVKGVDITVYDRHPSANVSCTVQIIAIEGNVVHSRTVSTSGSGALHKFLIANFNNASALGTLHMSCTIPPNSGGNFSHVTTYRLRTTP